MKVARETRDLFYGCVCVAIAASLGFMIGVITFKYSQPNDAASLDAALQSQAVCHAVAERMGIYVTIPPWQAMVLTPILDPR